MISCVSSFLKAGYQTLIPFAGMFHPLSLGLTSDPMLLDLPFISKEQRSEALAPSHGFLHRTSSVGSCSTILSVPRRSNGEKNQGDKACHSGRDPREQVGGTRSYGVYD